MYTKVLLAVFVLYLSTVQCNDIYVGYISATSRKIYGEMKEANPAIWKRSDDITIDAPANEVIDAVHVIDLRDKKDGEASITSGGIGQKSVTISVKSPTVLRGYQFLIEVYASGSSRQYYVKDGHSHSYYETQYPRRY